MTVLGFDTSAAHCAAALVSGGQVIGAVHEKMPRGQAERLMPMIEDLLTVHGQTLSDLEVIGVGTGPGNFTGIRISVAAARGLALGLGIPATGVTTFEAMAFGASAPSVLISIDARQDMGHLQRFDDGKPTSEPVTARIDALPEELIAGSPIVIGHAASQIAELWGLRTAEPAFSPEVAVALIAESRPAETGTRPTPQYIRAADAAPSRLRPPDIIA